MICFLEVIIGWLNKHFYYFDHYTLLEKGQQEFQI